MYWDVDEETERLTKRQGGRQDRKTDSEVDFLKALHDCKISLTLILAYRLCSKLSVFCYSHFFYYGLH